jgi:signal transduction histidine kinase
MRLAPWRDRPRFLLVVFGTATLAVAATLGWLGWRLLELDRALLAQRLQERLESAADLVAATLQQQLSDTRARLAGVAGLSPADFASAASREGASLADEALLVILAADRVDAYPPSRLLYYPIVSAPAEPPDALFSPGETVEYERNDYESALAAFRQAAASGDSALRAGTLFRVARALHKANRLDDALATYAELARLEETTIGGVASDLLARHARCTLLAQLGQARQLHDEARALSADLQRGRWRVRRAAYRFYAEETARWLGDEGTEVQNPVESQRKRALAAGVEALWHQWRVAPEGLGGQGRNEGRASLLVQDANLLLVWRATPDRRLVALVAGLSHIERAWLAGVLALMENQGLRLALADHDGRLVSGQWASRDTQQALRTSAETELPWTLQVVSVDPSAARIELDSRRRLLLAGLSLTVLVVLLGGYLTARAITRELQLARLQSSFVSAVSHEFRTPVASLRQMSELLAEGRVSSDARRQQYFDALRRESERLGHLVEGLLDFGRMEAGAREYRFEKIDPGKLVQEVSAEFGQGASERGYQLELAVSEELPPVRADWEALGRALWNLLDNAAKYSPTGKTIWVDARFINGQVHVDVRDQGIGIAPDDQRKIFDKFVRGANARSLGARGTGLGLTMVQRTVAAHGGSVHVESRPGEGSTFTIILPAATDQA